MTPGSLAFPLSLERWEDRSARSAASFLSLAILFARAAVRALDSSFFRLFSSAFIDLDSIGYVESRVVELDAVPGSLSEGARDFVGDRSLENDLFAREEIEKSSEDVGEEVQ